MSIELPLNTMTVPEKLQLMESLWASLCHKPADVASPEWHAKILFERKRRLETGEATVAPWSEAKKRLQELGNDGSH